MKLTKNFLLQIGACQEGIHFCERNQLLGIDTINMHRITGDHLGYIKWLNKKLENGYVFNSNGDIIQHEEPSGIKVYYQYFNGNLVKKTSMDSKIPFEYTYDYDSDGNLIYKQYNNIEIERWEYFNGMPSRYIKNNYIQTFSYENENEIHIQDSNSGFIKIYKDNNNNIIKRIHGFKPPYGYDHDIHTNIEEYQYDGDKLISETIYLISTDYRFPYNKGSFSDTCTKYVTHDISYHDNGQLKQYGKWLYLPLLTN